MNTTAKPKPARKVTKPKAKIVPRPLRPAKDVYEGTLRHADGIVEDATVIANAMRDCAHHLYRAGISYGWTDYSQVDSEADRESYFRGVYLRRDPRIAGSKPIAGTKEIAHIIIRGTGRTKEELDKFCASVPALAAGDYAVDFIEL